MTDEQRDDLLISISKGMMNLQEMIVDTKKELRQEIKASEERTKAELREEIKASEERTKAELREEIKKSAEETKAELREEIKKSAEETKTEIRQEINELEGNITTMFHDTWNYTTKENNKINKKLQEHEEQIQKINRQLSLKIVK